MRKYRENPTNKSGGQSANFTRHARSNRPRNPENKYSDDDNVNEIFILVEDNKWEALLEKLNESDTLLLGKIANTLTKEGDSFLGVILMNINKKPSRYSFVDDYYSPFKKIINLLGKERLRIRLGSLDPRDWDMAHRIIDHSAGLQRHFRKISSPHFLKSTLNLRNMLVKTPGRIFQWGSTGICVETSYKKFSDAGKLLQTYNLVKNRQYKKVLFMFEKDERLVKKCANVVSEEGHTLIDIILMDKKGISAQKEPNSPLCGYAAHLVETLIKQTDTHRAPQNWINDLDKGEDNSNFILTLLRKIIALKQVDINDQHKVKRIITAITTMTKIDCWLNDKIGPVYYVLWKLDKGKFPMYGMDNQGWNPRRRLNFEEIWTLVNENQANIDREEAAMHELNLDDSELQDEKLRLMNSLNIM